MPATVTVKKPENNEFKLGKDLEYGDIVYLTPCDDGGKTIGLVMYHPNNDAKKGIVDLENPSNAYIVISGVHYEMAPTWTEILIKVSN